jgi:hypothetical protein
MGPVTIYSKNPCQGDLNIKAPQFCCPFKSGDTLKFTVQVSDNDNNLSNIAEMFKIY